MSARRARTVLTLAVCLALLAPARVAHGGKKARPVSLASLPDWLREAAARPQPASGDADAVWLHAECLVEPLPAGGVRVTSRVAARVLREAGLRKVGSRTLLYSKGDEVLALTAYSLLGDGARASGEDDVVDQPWLPAMTVFQDTRARTVTAAGLTVGGVVGFEESVVRKLDRGLETFEFGDADRPTAWSRFTLKVPPAWGFRVTRLRLGGVEVEERADGVSFTARDLAPLAREEDAPPAEDVLPRVLARWWSPDGTRGFRDWDAVGRWYEALSGDVLGEPGEAHEVGERLRPAGPEAFLDALERAFAFVARDVRYVAVEIGIGGYRPHTPAETCRNRYGDCKDKAFLLRALVQSWGAKTYPVLVRVHSIGRVEPEAPSPGQFDHVIAGVLLPEGVGKDRWATVQVEGVGRLALLDATDRDGRSEDLPGEVQGTLGLVIHPGGAALVALPVGPPEAATATRMLAAAVDDQGQLTRATLVESFSGGLAASLRGSLAARSAEERRKDALLALQDRCPGARIRDYHVDGLDDAAERVVETTEIEGGGLGRRVGELLIVEPGKAAGGVVGRRVVAATRRFPLDLGPPRSTTVEIRVELPPGWVPEDLAKPLAVETPEIAARTSLAVEGSRLVYRRTTSLRVREVSAERYPAFHAAVGRVRGEEARAVVLVRKP